MRRTNIQTGMEEERKYKDIELRSEEVQEVMGQIPPAIQRYGIGVLLGIIVLLLVGSALFSYPEKVTTTFTLTSQNPPAYATAPVGGQIEQLYVKNGQEVRDGDYLAVLSNTARTEDILHLCERMEDWKRKGSRTEQAGSLFPSYMPRLGDVQSAYSSCLLAWGNYLQNMQGSRTYETELLNAVALLNTALSEWKSRYLLAAPIDGTVAFMQLWKVHTNVEQGTTVFVIIPPGTSSPVGKALLPMQGAGKVGVGQRAVIRLEGFPEQEFGFLEGEVVSISPVPDEEGNFVVEIGLPGGLTTHYRKELPVRKVMTGTADIITRECSLLQRIFLSVGVFE